VTGYAETASGGTRYHVQLEHKDKNLFVCEVYHYDASQTKVCEDAKTEGHTFTEAAKRAIFFLWPTLERMRAQRLLDAIKNKNDGGDVKGKSGK